MEEIKSEIIKKVIEIIEAMPRDGSSSYDQKLVNTAFLISEIEHFLEATPIEEVKKNENVVCGDKDCRVCFPKQKEGSIERQARMATEEIARDTRPKQKEDKEGNNFGKKLKRFLEKESWVCKFPGCTSLTVSKGTAGLSCWCRRHRTGGLKEERIKYQIDLEKLRGKYRLKEEECIDCSSIQGKHYHDKIELPEELPYVNYEKEPLQAVIENNRKIINKIIQYLKQRNY